MEKQFNKLDVDSFFLFSSLSESSDDYLYVWNLDEDILIASSNMANDFGLETTYITGFSNKFISMVHKQDKKRIQKEFDDFIDGKKTKLSLEYQIQKSNGNYIWVREHGVIKREGEDGHAKFMVGIFHNLENDGNVDRTTGLYMYDKGKENFDVFMHNHVGESGTILLLGLDDFATINTLNDHSFGDRVLRTIVQDIQTVLPRQANFYRYDGDQFLVLGKSMSTKVMKDLYNTIQTKAKKTREMDGKTFSLSFSAGMVAYPNDGSQWQDLIKRASLALKKAKDTGKNCCVMYEKELLNVNIYEQMISRLMNESVKNNCKGFRVVYQPVCESKYMSIYGAEALLRFDAPNGKTLRPDTFIPFLENNKLIIPVGTWVLEQAIIMCKKWLKEYPDFVMNVNVSYVQLYNAGFCDVVSHLLTKYQLDARHLTLELTESYFVNDADEIITTLERLHEMNIKLAMDDFGSGYSSLARLTQLHVDIVKIDKIFVQTLQTSSYTQNFIEAVVRLCHDMKLKVCVEGVETCFEQRYISMMRADYIQGYYVSRPMDADEFYNLYIQKEIDTSLLAVTPDREVRRKQLTGDAHFLQLLIDTTPMAMIIWNRDAEIISCNREALNLYGVDSEASLLNEFYHFSPKVQEDGESSKDKAERKIKETFINGYVEFDWQHLDVNGTSIPCEVQCTRVKHRDDFIIVSYTRDIRKQVEEEEQIRQTNSRIHALLDATPLCVNLWNRNMENTMCNQEAVKLFDLENEQQYIDYFFKLSPEYQPNGKRSDVMSFEKISEAFEKGYSQFKWMHCKLNREEIPAEITLVRIKDLDDNNEDMVAGYTRDIREQLENEEQVVKANSRIRALLDATPLCVNLWNRNMENTMCNQEAVKLFDLENEQQYIDYFFKLSPEYQPNGKRSDVMSFEKISEAFEKGYSQFKWMHCKLNKEEIPAEITLVRIKDLDDNEDMVAGYTRDIREQLENEEQVVKANSRIRALLDATPLCVNLWNRTMENMMCNREAAKLFDLKNEAEYIREFFHLSPEYQPNGKRSDQMSFEKINEAFEKGYSRFEWMHCKLNGEEIPAEITLVRIEGLDDDGSDMVAGYTRDIRQQLEVAEIERKANQRIIAVLNASPLSCLLWNDESECIDCNQVSVDLFGVNTKEELIHSFDDFMPFYQPDGTVSKDKKEYLMQKIKADKRLSFEWLYTNKNKEDIPCEVSLVSLEINDEKIVVAYNRDLRELKNTIELNTRLEQLAYYDILTGCASRVSFMETLNNEFMEGNEFTLMMFDLDHFKFINDTYGHEAGDITLEKVVSRISSILPEGAIIGRYGGDEFMILEKDMKGDGVKNLMERLIHEVEVLDIQCMGVSFHTSISIGATYCGKQDSVDDIIKRADEALYKAKNQGRNRAELILPE